MSNKRHFGWIFLLMLALSLLSPQGGTALQSPRITILSPGEGSLLTSPITLSAEIHPDPRGLIRVTLTSRNGDLLARQLLRVDTTNSTSPMPFNTDLAFEIPSDQTEALLTLAIQDDTYRTITIRSVLVKLITDGETILQPMIQKDPWLELTQPQPSDEISGGQILITGSVSPLSNRPITFELISDNGSVIGATQLAVEYPNEKFDYNFPLYYSSITEPTDVRLIVRQSLYPYNEVVILDSLRLSVFP
ncbi:MAG: hypothetical protein U9R53_10760 [Chloroflexota bacterium]|nr:hypothetical protein [Chloroflexota bacterium]